MKGSNVLSMVLRVLVVPLEGTWVERNHANKRLNKHRVVPLEGTWVER